MARKTCADLCRERYEDEALAKAVHESAVKAGTVKRIESGELVLPSVQDAKHWHQRLTGKSDDESDRAKALARIAELEKVVASLSAASSSPQQGYQTALEERIAALEKGGK